jgi:hypothetical protein
MKMVLICLLSVVASAQVEVTRLAKDDPVTGLKFVTVLLAVKGDKPYSDDPASKPYPRVDFPFAEGASARRMLLWFCFLP